MSVLPTPIDISAPLKQLCAALDLPYELVAEIIFKPTIVTARVYLLNENGKKWINPVTDQAAIELRAFAVRT